MRPTYDRNKHIKDELKHVEQDEQPEVHGAQGQETQFDSYDFWSQVAVEINKGNKKQQKPADLATLFHDLSVVSDVRYFLPKWQWESLEEFGYTPTDMQSESLINRLVRQQYAERWTYDVTGFGTVSFISLQSQMRSPEYAEEVFRVNDCTIDAACSLVDIQLLDAAADSGYRPDIEVPISSLPADIINKIGNRLGVGNYKVASKAPSPEDMLEEIIGKKY